jgi:hypothetical protein
LGVVALLSASVGFFATKIYRRERSVLCLAQIAVFEMKTLLLFGSLLERRRGGGGGTVCASLRRNCVPCCRNVSVGDGVLDVPCLVCRRALRKTAWPYGMSAVGCPVS